MNFQCYDYKTIEKNYFGNKIMMRTYGMIVCQLYIFFFFGNFSLYIIYNFEKNVFSMFSTVYRTFKRKTLATNYSLYYWIFENTYYMILLTRYRDNTIIKGGTNRIF